MGALKPEQLVGAVVRCLNADVAAMIWGMPGAGKTALVFEEIGPRLGLPVWDFRANSKEPVDLRGLPIVDSEQGLTRWVVPEDLPTEPALIFVDELNTCAKSMEAPLYSVIYGKHLGNWHGHKDTRIICAGNREQDRAVSNKMSTALLTRLGHFELDVDAEQWCLWASRSKRISPEMIAFIHMDPRNINRFDPNAKTSPIPRTVESADRIWQQDPPESTAHEEIAAHVGEGFATEFIAFTRLRSKMPDIAVILRDPKGAPVPDGRDALSIRFLVASILAQRMDRDNMTNICLYLDRLGEEFSVFAMKDAIARDGTMTKTKDGKANPAFVKWGASHSDLLG